MSKLSPSSKRSRSYKDLEHGISLLRKHLLPAQFDPTGTYKEYIYTRTFAFRVLAHAEIESYLETRVRELYKHALHTYTTKRLVSKSLICILAFSGLEMETPPESIQPLQSNQKSKWPEKLEISKKIGKAVSSLEHRIKQNHGIKEENLLQLLLSVGVEAQELDDVWIASMNSFGEERGLIAHTSGVTYRATTLPDPASEYKKVLDLLRGLKEVDEILNKLVDS